MASRTYVATETFTANVDGVPIFIRAGVDLVDEHHEIYKRFPQCFKPASERALAPDVEAATQNPGEKRGVHA